MKKEFTEDFLDFEDSLYEVTSEDIPTTCLHCGFTEKVPDFIYDGGSRKKYHFNLKRKVSTLYCSNCEKETAVPSSFLNN